MAEVKQFPLEEEYKKKTGITPTDIKKLRDWLATQPHLPGQQISDLELILAYHCSSRSSEVTKQLIDLYFTLRTLFTNFFKNRIVDDKILDTFRKTLLMPLQVRAYDDSAVIYCRLLDYDVKTFVFHEAIRACLMNIDLWQYEMGTWPGLVILIDLDQVTLSHLARLDFQTLQQFLYYLQEALLVNLKGLHFLNAPSFMDRLMMMLKPFLKKALLEVLHIHQIGSRTLDKFLPMDGLPVEAGGKCKTFDQARDEIVAKIKANRKFFDNDQRVVDESKRPGKPKTITDIFGGVEGSFKKLEID